MPSMSFFILGLVVATATANETTIWNITASELNNSTHVITTTTASIITNISTSITDANTPSIYIYMNDTESSGVPATTAGPGKITPGRSPGAETAVATPTPGDTSERMTATAATTTKPSTQTASPARSNSETTSIIILIVLFIMVVAFLTACYLVHKRRRRDSVDFSSRQDEANIPLSNMEPVEAAPQNGLTTFASTETAAKEPEELEAKPEAKAEAQLEQKAETDGSAGEPTTESAAPAPALGSSEDRPKGDAAEPPAPVESTVEDKTDDEAAISNKTSVESLKEKNENNSNNADFSQAKNLIFWDEVPLDCPL